METTRRQVLIGAASAALVPSLPAAMVMPTSSIAEVAPAKPILTGDFLSQLTEWNQWALQTSVYECNDHFTRSAISTLVRDFMSRQEQQVHHYVIICNETNNPPELIDANMIAIEVWWVSVTEMSEETSEHCLKTTFDGKNFLHEYSVFRLKPSYVSLPS